MPSVFAALSSQRIAELIGRARRHVCYAAPGIQVEAAQALVRLAKGNPNVAIAVSLDFDERTLRMGYGSLRAVETLRSAGIAPCHFAGFRSSVLIVDEHAWVFTPTALYLEEEPHSDETPNAIRLSAEQSRDLLLRLSPPAREQAIAESEQAQPEARDDEAEQPASPFQIPPLEASGEPVEDAHFDSVKKAIVLAPPVKFDVARQVRVFEPYLQYVELHLTGAAVQRRRVQIPKSIEQLGTSKELKGRLNTTLDLIEKSSELSSAELDAELSEIRKNLTPSLGKVHGRVVLKNVKPFLLKRLAELREKLKQHQAKVEGELQERLDKTKEDVILHYTPIVQAKPPDALIGQSLLGKPDEDEIRNWLGRELDRAIPSAKSVIDKMTLTELYKDVTFEALNHPDFIESIKEAFPNINWDKTYAEFMAAGESETKVEEPPKEEGIE